MYTSDEMDKLITNLNVRLDCIEEKQDELIKLLYCFIRSQGNNVDRILERYEEEYLYYKESLK